MATIKEPEGIKFYNVKSGETHHAKLEPTIAAYINSSDMGINASRDQDFGWKLHPDWVAKLRNFKDDENQMSVLSGKLQGQDPTDVQILYHLYGEQLRKYHRQLQDNSAPYEEEYRKAIAEPAKNK